MKHAVVDGANVAYMERSESGDPRVSNLVAMVRTLEQKGYQPVVIVDASLRHEVDDPRQLEGLLEEEQYHQAPADTDADYFILRTADRLEGYVISNDEFNENTQEYPWLPERRVPFMIIDGTVELYEKKLQESD